jgi:hypothetical protein
MADIRPRDLLTDTLLARLGGTAGDTASSDFVARDIAKLAGVGYLNVALPPEFSGLGCTLRQAACGQRRLARHAPRTAAAISAHLYWTGAAADAYRSGDSSVRWILLEAARGALFAAGHGAPGNDLRFASPHSRCEPAGESGYRFRNPPVVLSAVTPSWDWVAVHGITGERRPDTVLAFAGRGARCTPAFRVARVLPSGAPSDVFTTSAVAWGNSLLASAEYSIERRAFNDALVALDRQLPAGGARHLDQWPIAEASLRLDAMKSAIAAVTHPWPLVPEEGPDLSGQSLIGIYTMRHQVADGAAHVRRLISQMTTAPAVAAI